MAEEREGDRESAPPAALVVGHGGYAEGVVSAVVQITGAADRLIALSNRDYGAAELEAAIRQLVESRGVRVIFSDLPAGSCAFAARRVVRDRADVRLVTGANVAALLHWLAHDEAHETDAVAGAVERGKGSITVVGSAGGR